MKIKQTICLAGENISIGGFIEKLKCINCDYNSFRLRLQAENDSLYYGVAGLTDKENNRLLITHLSGKEHKEWNNQTPKELENRINKIFNTTTFKFFSQKHFIDKTTNEKIFRPICPKCNEYLIKEKYLEFDEYINSGGQIISMDSYINE